MLTKQSLTNTFNLINSANISVVSSTDNGIGYKLALSLDCVYFENVQYYPPKTIDEIIDTTRQLLNQFECENHCRIELLILNFYQISNNFELENLNKILLELNKLSIAKNFKAIVLFTGENTSLLAKAYSNFTPAKKNQILMLTMSAEQPIKITVETGKHKGESIFYEFDNEVELLSESKN